MSWRVREEIKKKLKTENGAGFVQREYQMGILYPASYRVGMASLGFLTIYDQINNFPDWSCERSFKNDPPYEDETCYTYESLRPLNEFYLLGVSISYEGEISTLIKMLINSKIEPLREKRGEKDPIIIIGGPLTTIAPESLYLFGDVIVIGEAEELIPQILKTIEENEKRDEILKVLSEKQSIWVPEISKSIPPAMFTAKENLGAVSTIITPDAEFGERVLIEIERGCSRKCGFCVMGNHSEKKGMRIVDYEKIIKSLDPLPLKVGLVGAAVTDHPQIKSLLKYLTQNNVNVTLSSLRADRIDEEFIELLKKGGMQTITVALDGSSKRLRTEIKKTIREEDIINVARLARKYGINKMKLYQLIGLPGETNDDLHEMSEFILKLSRETNLSVTISPFVPKPGTPLEKSPFSNEKIIKKSISFLKKTIKGKVILKPVSYKEAALEYYVDTTGKKAGSIIYESVVENWNMGKLIKQLKLVYANN
jgi:radical SAM superfamily enzyme YgiQ (UPF0313 family)